MPQSNLLNFFTSRGLSNIPKDSGLKEEERAFSANDGPNEDLNTNATLNNSTAAEKAQVPNTDPAAVESGILEIKRVQTPHSSLTITAVDKDSVQQLKRLTATLLQVKYPDTFFDEAVSVHPVRYLSRQVVFGFPDGRGQGSPVGWIRCRLEVFPLSTRPEPYYPISSDESRPTQIYIQALCLLAPYRGYGAAAALLDSILSEKEVLRSWDVRGVYAHVWEKSEDALEWYKKRGFKLTMLIDGYYRKLKPSRAWIVWLPLDIDK
ncbi:putative gnat family acetyltransferase [Phaeomoniella chlamydospora]|uniref:Putative gnat family acetyltransferase n=1 Tax=Phaeomoniella chlamydospora TaxID=158046 RepID=A0A0G2ERT5_PHACM|nr:putative gnat family acetyltransferase [Phaeomoniella chlamydospora]